MFIDKYWYLDVRNSSEIGWGECTMERTGHHWKVNSW